MLGLFDVSIAQRQSPQGKVRLPVLRKQVAIGAGTARENSSPEEDDRLQAAIDAWNDVNTQIEEFIAENVGRR
jgi:hypothetical protein